MPADCSPDRTSTLLVSRDSHTGDGSGPGVRSRAGLLLAYALILLFGLTLVLNVVYLIALGFMRGRYENGYGRASRALLYLIPAATALGLTLR